MPSASVHSTGSPASWTQSPKWVVKAMNGFNHSLAFTLQNFPEPIRITPLNKTIALNNCSYCHGEFVSLVDHAGQQELEDCTRCHALRK